MTPDEDGLRWTKARASSAGNNCVEVAVTQDGMVLVRDSKDRGGPALCFSRSEWAAFLSGAKGGEFDSAP